MWLVYLVSILVLALLLGSFTGYGVYRAGQYPTEHQNYEFSDYGYWGLTASEIGNKAEASTELAEVLSAIDALQNIELHSESSLADAFDEVKKIDKRFNGNGKELSSTRGYATFDFTPESKLPADHTISDAVFHALVSIRESLMYRKDPEISETTIDNIDKYFQAIKPESGSLLDSWQLENNRLENLTTDRSYD